jgi:hypothetical protein
MTLNNENNNQLITVNHTLGARLKAVNLSGVCQTKRIYTTLYVEKSIDASTEEVYWLSTYIHKYNKRTSTQVVCRTVVVLAQQENKGWYYNNK